MTPLAGAEQVCTVPPDLSLAHPCVHLKTRKDDSGFILPLEGTPMTENHKATFSLEGGHPFHMRCCSLYHTGEIPCVFFNSVPDMQNIERKASSGFQPVGNGLYWARNKTKQNKWSHPKSIKGNCRRHPLPFPWQILDLAAHALGVPAGKGNSEIEHNLDDMTNSKTGSGTFPRRGKTWLLLPHFALGTDRSQETGSRLDCKNVFLLYVAYMAGWGHEDSVMWLIWNT